MDQIKTNKKAKFGPENNTTACIYAYIYIYVHISVCVRIERESKRRSRATNLKTLLLNSIVLDFVLVASEEPSSLGLRSGLKVIST